MAGIASRSRYATTGLVYNLHHIALSVLHQIGEEHRIASYDHEESTSHGPSIRPPVSSTAVRMQPFEVEGEGEGELIGEVVVEMVGEVMVEMVRAVMVHLSRLCLLRYPPPYLPLT